MAKAKRLCALCGDEYLGRGNNASPLKPNKLCCDKCNLKKVVPARIKLSNYKNNDKA